MQCYALLLPLTSDDGEHLFIRLIRLIYNLKSIERNPNLSKFGLLNSLDLPIQKTKLTKILNTRVFRTLVNFIKTKFQKYTFGERKCTQKFAIFQNSSTSRTRILIGPKIGPTYLI